jgi:hypothetical protein
LGAAMSAGRAQGAPTTRPVRVLKCPGRFCLFSTLTEYLYIIVPGGSTYSVNACDILQLICSALCAARRGHVCGTARTQSAHSACIGGRVKPWRVGWHSPQGGPRLRSPPACYTKVAAEQSRAVRRCRSQLRRLPLRLGNASDGGRPDWRQLDQIGGRHLRTRRGSACCRPSRLSVLHPFGRRVADDVNEKFYQPDRAREL